MKDDMEDLYYQSLMNTFILAGNKSYFQNLPHSLPKHEGFFLGFVRVRGGVGALAGFLLGFFRDFRVLPGSGSLLPVGRFELPFPEGGTIFLGGSGGGWGITPFGKLIGAFGAFGSGSSSNRIGSFLSKVCIRFPSTYRSYTLFSPRLADHLDSYTFAFPFLPTRDVTTSTPFFLSMYSWLDLASLWSCRAISFLDLMGP